MSDPADGRAARRASPASLGELWKVPAHARSALLPGTGVQAAVWSLASGTRFLLPPLGTWRLVINLTPLDRHTLWIEGREARDAASPLGVLRIAPPGEAATADVWGNAGCSFLQLYVPRAALAEAAEALGLRGGREPELRDPLFGAGDPLAAALARAVLEADPGRDASATLYADGMARALATHLVFAHGSRDEASAPPAVGALSPQRLRRVLAHAEANLGARLTVAELAAVAGISPYHFSRAFRAATGRPPHAHIIALRVERARRMMRETSASLSEIAAALGFADQAHLARRFRAATGMTPGAYAREHRRGMRAGWRRGR